MNRWAGLILCLWLLSHPPSTTAAEGLTSFTGERQAYRHAISALLDAENFYELESRADSLRRDKPRFSSGAPVLFDFYEGLNPAGHHVPGSLRGRYHTLLERWQANRPTSLTPRVPLIDS